MIPKAYIDEWRDCAPWQDAYQVEQDLIISRSLNAIFSDPILKKKLAFRGGTALHKLFIQPAARYSEDIDLVQIQSEPFGPVMDQLRECLSFLGTPTRKQKEHNNTMVYRFDSAEGLKMKLKIEINTREHFTVFGYQQIPFQVASNWHKSEGTITTFTLEELLSTKLRALYQRKKGRDLFDLWYAITKLDCKPENIVESWGKYMKEENHSISRREFELNLEAKMESAQFIGDINMLIREGIGYNVPDAMEIVRRELIELI
ncbi:MAG: nucleotidyl transferase AbiEii/AbiGii toxin family protein [Bacteroidetes bacterium]|nr:nucleotidyl transferase AbiEii/AbiGii toxin family protein [Bacteroidota bacterium]